MAARPTTQMKSPINTPTSMNRYIATNGMVSKTPSPSRSLCLISHDSVGGDVKCMGGSESFSMKRSRDDSIDKDFREDRKAANRRSAYQSRLRKKLLIEELQEKVADIAKHLDIVRDENKSLLYSLESALSENRRLRYVQQERLILGKNGAFMNVPGMFPNNGGLGINSASLSALWACRLSGAGFDASSFSF